MRMPPLPADSIHARACKLKCEKILTRPLNQEAFIRRLYYKRGITKLVAPNLNFKDIIIHENDSLKCIGTITGIAHGCRWE